MANTIEMLGLTPPYLPWHADPDVPRWHEQVPPVHGYPEHSAENRHPVRGAFEKKEKKLFIKIIFAQEIGSILKIGFTLAHWPHLHRAYEVESL